MAPVPTPVLIYDGQTVEVPGARADGGGLWLTTADLTRATGWELKPEGACLGDRCVPIPAGQERRFLDVEDDRTWLCFSALAAHTGRAVAWDERHAVWSFGEEPAVQRERRTGLLAPDFTLPDLDGAPHTLSDYRGQKVILYAWASW